MQDDALCNVTLWFLGEHTTHTEREREPIRQLRESGRYWGKIDGNKKPIETAAFRFWPASRCQHTEQSRTAHKYVQQLAKRERERREKEDVCV